MKRNLFVLILLVFVAAGFKCGGGEVGLYEGKTSNKHQIRTVAGATLSAEFKPNPSWGPLVDGGFADVNRIASLPPNNYDVSDLSAASYIVWYMRRSPKCENPAFLVNATGSVYEGSEWDKDPSPNRCLICAAGMTIMRGFPTITGPGMLITDDVGVMRTIVRYEAEHSILFYKDHERYNATMYHTNGQGHPILGEGPPVESIAAAELEKYKDTYRNLTSVTLELPIDVADSSSVVAPKGRPACVLLTK